VSETEVTHLIGRVAFGDSRAEQALWETYFTRLVGYARKKLENVPRRAADEEDVALSAMYSFCRGMAAGRFSHVDNRHDLWKLLVTITARKASAQRRRHFAQKRGGGHVGGESVFLGGEDEAGRNEGLAAVLGDQPTPEMACLVAEQCKRMLDALPDDSLRQVAQMTLEGYSPQEIAEQLGCVRRTVERKLERIREKWSKAGARSML
jgi:RNA polymerase sigma factor (sigma-70 family)